MFIGVNYRLAHTPK